MNSTFRWSRRSWWFLAIASVAIVSLAAAAVKRGSQPQAISPLTVHAAAPKSLLPAMFLELPDGRFAARATDLAAEFMAGGVARFLWRDSAIEMRMVGAQADVRPEGFQPLTTRVSYFSGTDASGWRADLPAFAGVRYRELYPGIEMVYKVAGRFKSEFLVAAGADPARIRMRFSGAERLAVTGAGSLRVFSREGELQDEQVVAFQEASGGGRVAVTARFQLIDGMTAGFELGAYDRSRPLVIDPVLSYSSYLGGTRLEQTTGVAVSASGEAYISGWTDSQTFPVVNSLRGYGGSVESFVAKVSASGNTVEWATFLGGSGDDRAMGIAIDSTGNSYVVGFTASSNFPILSALQTNRAGLRDAFVTKINPTGTALVYSTYWGGSDNDQANAVAVDAFGQAYVVGETSSANFPTVFPWISSLGGPRDAFHFKIGVNGNVSYSTYIGGNGDDRATSVAVSTTLTPYVAGCTGSTNFPTRLAQQSTLRGSQDGFVLRFLPDADNVIYSTYLGGNSGSTGLAECINGIALDSFNNIYAAGVTTSLTGFPIQAAVQNTHNGGTYDGFLTKLDSDGYMLYSTFIGGSGSDLAMSVKVDSARRAVVTGYTASKNFPVYNPIQSINGGLYDVFVMRYDPEGLPLLFGTYLGGAGNDTALSLAMTADGTIYIVGNTNSANYPKLTPFQPNLTGSIDGFITKITGF